MVNNFYQYTQKIQKIHGFTWLTKGIYSQVTTKTKFCKAKDQSRRDLLLHQFKIYRNLNENLKQVKKSTTKHISKKTNIRYVKHGGV